MKLVCSPLKRLEGTSKIVMSLYDDIQLEIQEGYKIRTIDTALV